MRVMQWALVERLLDLEGVAPNVTQYVLGLAPSSDLERGRYYLEMCQTVDELTCPELPVTDMVVCACNEYGVSPSTFWRAWSYYQRLGSSKK